MTSSMPHVTHAAIGRLALATGILVLLSGLAPARAQPPGPGPGGFGPPAAFAGPGSPGSGGFGRQGGPGGPDGPGGPGRPFLDGRRLADYLGLSDEQRASARQIFEAQRDKVRPLMDEQRALREQLDGLLDDPGATDAALGQLVKQLHANRQALATAHQELESQLASILDEGQKAKLKELHDVMSGLGLGPGHRTRGPR